ncbi:hypothetical protein [Paraburkholderia mimosarum]|uniref:hypothetical protein n=1 Tax=Paraburkholderia mimosarum TaxID=312026 RepID=UPI000566DF19|nr:hypothetical protein [Paraburkholderia mimosarum]
MMDGLQKAWAAFLGWHWLARRAAIAAACYAGWLFTIFLYSQGLKSLALDLSYVFTIGFVWAIGGWYVILGALRMFLWWTRISR